MFQTHVIPLFACWSGEQMKKEVFVGFTCLQLTLAGSIGQTETSFFGKVDEPAHCVPVLLKSVSSGFNTTVKTKFAIMANDTLGCGQKPHKIVWVILI